MNNLDNYGRAGGMRCKAPDAPHGHSLQAFGNAAARPPVRPECSSYSWADPYLNLPIAAHPRAPEAVARQIQHVLTDMADAPEGIKALQAAVSAIAQQPPYGFFKAGATGYAKHAVFYRNTLVKDVK